MIEDIRIYLADLSAYNNGKLHGIWINALDDLDEIQDQINGMLKDSPEEYAIHDYEGFDGYGLSEYEGMESAHEIACFIDGNQETGGELLNHFGGELEDAKKSIEENHNGCHST